MKIIIEVSGGCVSKISATEKCDIFFIDHDNLKSRDDAIYELGAPNEPDEIISETDVDRIIENHIAIYK